MKKIVLFVAAICCALCACSDDDTKENAVQKATISLSSDTIPAGADGTTAEITVTSSADWRLAGVCDWVHPSAVSGKSGVTVTFTVDPNTTDELREATFKFFTGSAVAPLKVTSEPGYRLELVSDEGVTFESGTAELKLKLSTNIPELTSTFTDNGDSWITYTGRSDAFGTTILSYSVAANPDYDNRYTELSVDGMGQTVKVKITQRQIDGLTTDRDKFEFDLSEQRFSVVVTTNVDFKVTCPDWIEQVESRGLENQTLNFRIGASEVSRGGKITLSGAGITRTITVIQKDPDAVVFAIPDEAFRNLLVEQNWVLDLGTEFCIVTAEGLQATEFVYTPNWNQTKIKSLEGIGAFPELTTIRIDGNSLSELDLSALTKVSTLSCSEMDNLSTIRLGANPITEFAIYNGEYDYIYGSFDTLTIAGERLVTVNCAITSYYSMWDQLKAVDVSECPALQTLDCRRGDMLTTLYLKEGQVIPNLLKKDVTQIVYK